MNGLNKNPYLSIITPSRNDDHGGDLLRRMQLSLYGLLVQLEKYRIESEFILIDWNAPADKPLLKDVIKWPSHRLSYCTIRIIEVPSSIHQRYKGSDKMPMNVVAAINCGIRRARGQFVLPRPADLIYSDELVSYLARKTLRKGERYRIDRCDVDRNVLQFDTLEEQLEYCEKNIIKINGKGVSGKRLNETKLPDLHTNASGDFQVMSGYYWRLLGGYFETDIVGAYVDGILSYASYAAGVKEVVLRSPIRLYHIDHNDKFNSRITTQKLPLENWLSLGFIPNWMSNKLIGLYRRCLTCFGYKLKSSVHGIPTLEFSEYRKMCQEIVVGRRSYVLTDEGWGLGRESLNEFVVNLADWDKLVETESQVVADQGI